MCGSLEQHGHLGGSDVREPRTPSATLVLRCAGASSTIGTLVPGMGWLKKSVLVSDSRMFLGSTLTKFFSSLRGRDLLPLDVPPSEPRLGTLVRPKLVTTRCLGLAKPFPAFEAARDPVPSPFDGNGSLGGPCSANVAEECYLVDRASSHMLVLPAFEAARDPSTKSPFDGNGLTTGGPYLSMPMHFARDTDDARALLSPLHCSRAGLPHGEHRFARPYWRRCAPGFNWSGHSSGAVTLKKLECSEQDFDPIVLAFGIGVMINRDSRGHSYFIVRERKLGARRRSDTVLVSTINDADQGSADVAFRTPPAPYEKSKSLGSGGSMVARLKLKGIDGRAPPGVEPAT
ncbi:hypothetical protein GOBAR_DD19274 [Gossypium barbadense]|nr:hypothetical protein GOBAR_DD19274 [Gossypium barbadense]